MQAYLDGAVGAAGTPSAVPAGTVRRSADSARPHRVALGPLVLVTAVSAALLVGMPLLAGRVVDTIVGRGDAQTVVRLALAIACLAIAGAALGLVERRLSARSAED